MLELAAIFFLLQAGFEARDGVFLLFFAFVVAASAVAVFYDARILNQSSLVPKRWAGYVVLVWTISIVCYLKRRADAQLDSARKPPPLWQKVPASKTRAREVSLSAQIKAWAFAFAVLLVALAAAIFIISMADFSVNLESAWNDRADMLFGVASVALMLISLFGAFLAIIGWQSMRESLVKHVDQQADRRSQELTKKLTDEIKGRVHYIAGNIFRALCLEGGDDSAKELVKPSRMELLERAIYHSHEALNPLHEADSEKLFDAKNNLAYNLALGGDPSDARLARSLAFELFDRQLKVPDDDYLLTYIRVLMEYPEDEKELKEAEVQLDRVRTRRDTTAIRKKYVQLYLDVLNNALPTAGTTEVEAETKSISPERLAQKIDDFRNKCSSSVGSAEPASAARKAER